MTKPEKALALINAYIFIGELSIHKTSRNAKNIKSIKLFHFYGIFSPTKKSLCHFNKHDITKIVEILLEGHQQSCQGFSSSFFSTYRFLLCFSLLLAQYKFYCSSVIIVDFKWVSHIALLLLLFTLNDFTYRFIRSKCHIFSSFYIAGFEKIS